MPWDAQLTTALEGILRNLREHLDEDFRALTQELSRAIAAERSRVAADAAEAASAEVRRQAQQQIAQLRDATKLETQEIRRAAELQVAELRRALEDMRRSTQAQVDHARQSESELAVARQRAAADLEQVRVRAAAETESTRRRAALEVEDARRLAQMQVDDVQRQMEARMASARAEARAEMAARGQQILDGMHALDGAVALRDVLERLGEAAATQADRTVVFVVRNAMLVEAHRVGFPPSMPRIEFYLQDAGFMMDIVPTGTSAETAGGLLPPFAATAEARDAAAMPVTVGGQVVAVLYGDAPREARGAEQWPAMVEVLARYASRVLETITVQQLWAPAVVAQGSQNR